MKSIMEELWNGNIRPQETITNEDKEYQRNEVFLKNIRENLEKTFTVEQQTMFAQYEVLYEMQNKLITKDAFLCGMRLGVRIVSEPFDKK